MLELDSLLGCLVDGILRQGMKLTYVIILSPQFKKMLVSFVGSSCWQLVLPTFKNALIPLFEYAASPYRRPVKTCSSLDKLGNEPNHILLH